MAAFFSEGDKLMNRIVRDVRRPFRPWNRRYRALSAEAREPDTYMPRDIFLYVGATILLFVAAWLTINYVVQAFSS